MTARRASANYLAESEKRGLLYTVDGCHVVAGETDQMDDKRKVLIEYCDPSLFDREENLNDLIRFLQKKLPDVHAWMLRSPGDVDLRGTWHPYISYVRYSGDHPSMTGKGNVRVARNSDIPQIARWLSEAFANAGRYRSEPPNQSAVDEDVRGLLARNDRRSYVIDFGEGPVGHATLFTGQVDAIHGTAHVDLFDILIERSHDVRSSMIALTATAVALANSMKVPLIGNVVHDLRAQVDDELEHGNQVLASLFRKGWESDHRYWYRH